MRLPSRSYLDSRVLGLEHRVFWLRLDPGRRGGSELGDQVEVGADQRDDRAGDQEHVDRVEARQRGGAELRTGAEEVGQERPDERAGAADIDAYDRRPVAAPVERQEI